MYIFISQRKEWLLLFESSIAPLHMCVGSFSLFQLKITKTLSTLPLFPRQTKTSLCTARTVVITQIIIITFEHKLGKLKMWFTFELVNLFIDTFNYTRNINIFFYRIFGKFERTSILINSNVIVFNVNISCCIRIIWKKCR